MSQASQILAALQDGNKITTLRALRDFGCLRLAARINELRKGGHDIRSELIGTSGKRYAMYYMAEKEASRAER